MEISNNIIYWNNSQFGERESGIVLNAFKLNLDLHFYTFLSVIIFSKKIPVK